MSTEQLTKRSSPHVRALAELTSKPVDTRLREHAERFAAEARALVDEASAAIDSRSQPVREGVDQVPALRRAAELLTRAADVHEVELRVRHWLTRGALSEHIVLIVGAYTEERSLGFIAGLIGNPIAGPNEEPLTCVWQAARGDAWREGWRNGWTLHKRKRARTTADVQGARNS